MFKTIVATAAVLAAVEGRHVNDVEANIIMDSFFRTHGKHVKADAEAKGNSKVKREANNGGSAWWRVNSEDHIDGMVQVIYILVEFYLLLFLYIPNAIFLMSNII